MSINRTVFANNDSVASASATSRDLVYTASNGTATIGAAVAYNSSAAAVDVMVCLRSDATTSGTVALQEKVSVPAGACEDLAKLIGQNVPQGGSIQAYAGTASVITLYISGTTKA